MRHLDPQEPICTRDVQDVRCRAPRAPLLLRGTAGEHRLRVCDLRSGARELRPKIQKLYRRLGPLGALASGLVSVFLVRRGVTFAPLAAALVVLAWALGAGMSRWLPEGERTTRMQAIARFLAASFVAGIYQDVLFFLLPFWIGSATWPSINMLVPIGLAALALFSCFEEPYARIVLRRPIVRAIFSAAILFAALVAATPVLLRWPLRVNLAASAGASVIFGALAVVPIGSLRSGKALAGIAAAAVVSALVAAALAPLLPPVPVQTVAVHIAPSIKNREPLNPSESYEEGVDRVYAWTAIAAPKRYAESIRFEWFRDGLLISSGFETVIVGGRKEGFRTWGYVSSPRAGAWRVDLVASSGQLLARRRFVVRGIEKK